MTLKRDENITTNYFLAKFINILFQRYL